jgi:AcrR family transcriptional regulator
LGWAASDYSFPSREALVEALMERGLRQTHDAVVEALAAPPADAGPEDRLRSMIECDVRTLLLDDISLGLRSVC